MDMLSTLELSLKELNTKKLKIRRNRIIGEFIMESNEFAPLVDSYIKGNVSYVLNKLFTFRENKIVSFMYYLVNDCKADMALEIAEKLRDRYK